MSSALTLADVLEKLIRMEVVQKEAPINAPTNKRKTGYRITDNLSLFYYRYVYRHASQMSVMDSDVFFERYIAADFEQQYVPRIFENIAGQYLIRQNKAGKLEDPFEKIGKYHYDDSVRKKNGEFDVVTQDVIRKNVKNILIPSEEMKIQVYPLNYEEFCEATGGNYELLRQIFNTGKPIGQATNRKLMRDLSRKEHYLKSLFI